MKEIPEEFDRVRAQILRAIAPLKPSDSNTTSKKDFLFSGRRAVSGSDLPPPYLIYLLFVELLGFSDLGRFEKVAWSIPIDLNGKAFLIEHRKFGVGVFTQDESDLEDAKKIAVLIKKGVRYATPYFKWKAEEAVKASEFNVTNNSHALFERYEYLARQFRRVHDEADERKDEVMRTPIGSNGFMITHPSYNLYREAKWLAMSAIDAFYSWTEHVFIHIAILNGAVSTGPEFTSLSGAEWNTKFKAALDFSDPKMKQHFDKLITLRRQLRNFLAHGAFGKDGETLQFHSSAGAVPVLFDVTAKKNGFYLGESLDFDEVQAFAIINEFLDYLWDGPRKAAQVYVQDYCLPLIMTYAQNGTYKDAMSSPEKMKELASHLAERMDNAANMDW